MSLRDKLIETLEGSDQIGCGCCTSAREVSTGPEEWEVDYTDRIEALAEDIEAALVAAGYGKLEDAKAAALVEAADALDRLHRIGATRSDQCTPEEKADYRAYAEFNGGHSAWLRARAVTERA